jgi:tetratricopeptide (TPR) repeat protein
MFRGADMRVRAPGRAALSGRLRVRQIARNAKTIAVAAFLCAAAFSTANAMGPLAGPAGATQADRQVSPESCLACERAADWRACHQAALTLAMEREWTRAIAVEEAVRRMQPGNAEVAAVLARMYQEGTRNTARVFELYHEALGSSPGYPPALLGLGTMMQDLGSLDVAARYFERGARERPDEPQFKVRLADVLVKAGREEEARPILREIVERWPGSREAETAKRLMPATSLARP